MRDFSPPIPRIIRHEPRISPAIPKSANPYSILPALCSSTHLLHPLRHRPPNPPPQNLINTIISPLLLGIPSPPLSHITYSTAPNLSLTSLSTPAVTTVPLLPPHTNTGVLAFPSPMVRELTYPLTSPIALFEPAIPVPIAITPPNSTPGHASTTASAAIPPCP
ncbi:hypothetical protein VC83_01446 [Pseudogymnoascus destructans]|uniref:Uncharacterized protein n=1 Tax=Pseudogymnoascus destructans TaxID=655981 RepID=A0A177AII0_9PEZI|nr:uncharacterized protein VC83_01446 [Pseudogymnoascus destructans]OAF61879.1 hypothetical protein VC83_01446 [Pseudogymnoascus destructans]